MREPGKRKGLLAGIVIFLLFTGAALAGCRQEHREQEEQTETAAEERESLTILLPYDNPVYQKTIETLMEDFEGDHPHLQVQLEWVSDRDYEKRLANLKLKGQVPDMALVDNAYVPLLASSGVLCPLDVWLNSTGIKEELAGSMEDGLMVEKTQYGCPFLCWSYGLFFQNDILNRSGCTVPKSWEEWEAYGLEVQRINNVQPFALAASDSEELMYQFLELLQGQGMILQRMHYESNCLTLELTEQLLKENSLIVNGLNWNQADLTRTFAKGNLACMLNRSTQVPFLKSLNPSMKWIVTEPYLGAEGRHVIGIQSMVLAKGAKPGAYELLGWLMQKEQVERFSREMNSIPVRADVRKEFKEQKPDGVLSMDWEGRMQFGGSYLSWGSISKEVRSSFRRMLMGELTAEECFQEMKYNMEQYLYLLVYE